MAAVRWCNLNVLLSSGWIASCRLCWPKTRFGQRQIHVILLSDWCEGESSCVKCAAAVDGVSGTSCAVRSWHRQGGLP
jgi:hypothetical protein